MLIQLELDLEAIIEIGSMMGKLREEKKQLEIERDTLRGVEIDLRSTIRELNSRLEVYLEENQKYAGLTHRAFGILREIVEQDNVKYHCPSCFQWCIVYQGHDPKCKIIDWFLRAGGVEPEAGK